jgi:membrane protein DedA with SNARE-associated domain
MTGVITRFGVLGVFALMVPESACIPIPSEVTLLFSGFAVREGWMTFTGAVLAATAGNLVGSLIAYGLGASRILERVPGARGLLHRSEGLLDRHGIRGVLIARLLPLARTFVSLPAGARRVPLPAFVAMTTAGCAVWAGAFITVGLLAGSAWMVISSVLGRVLLGLGLLILAFVFLRHSSTTRRHTPPVSRPVAPAGQRVVHRRPGVGPQ